MPKSTIEMCPVLDPGMQVKANKAWVFYSSYNGTSISEHAIDSSGNAGPAKWLDAEGIRKESMSWKERQEQQSPCFLPYRLLSSTEDEVVWYVPSSKRAVAFTAPEHAKHHGQLLDMPHMVFRARVRAGLTELKLFTLKSEPKGMADKLFVSPFPNTYKDGGVCLGSTVKHGVRPADAEKWTDAFFNSKFTHGSYVKYWTAVAKGKAPKLKPTTVTLGHLINGHIEDTEGLPIQGYDDE